MGRRLDRALDACLAAMSRGDASLDECAARYPDLAAELRPLLELGIEIERMPRAKPDAARAAAGKRAMLRAVAERDRARAHRSPVVNRRGHTRLGRATAVGLAALVVLLVAGVVAEFVLPPGIARAATLEGVRGQVEVLPAGADHWVAGEDGVRLLAGSRVRTGPDSAASVMLPQGCEVSLGADTDLEIGDLRARPSGLYVMANLYQERGGSTISIAPRSTGELVLEVATLHARIRARTGRRVVSLAVRVDEAGTDLSVAAGAALVESATGVTQVAGGETARVIGAMPIVTPGPEEGHETGHGPTATPDGHGPRDMQGPTDVTGDGRGGRGEDGEAGRDGGSGGPTATPSADDTGQQTKESSRPARTPEPTATQVKPSDGTTSGPQQATPQGAGHGQQDSGAAGSGDRSEGSGSSGGPQKGTG